MFTLYQFSFSFSVFPGAAPVDGWSPTEWIVCLQTPFICSHFKSLHLVFWHFIFNLHSLAADVRLSVLAVPTDCSSGLRPWVWRGAEGRCAPRWGSRTGAAGTVLLPQERAVQTAWRSGQHRATHTRTPRIQHTHANDKDTEWSVETRRCWEDETDKETRGRVERKQERSELNRNKV